MTTFYNNIDLAGADLREACVQSGAIEAAVAHLRAADPESNVQELKYAAEALHNLTGSGQSSAMDRLESIDDIIPVIVRPACFLYHSGRFRLRKFVEYNRP